MVVAAHVSRVSSDYPPSGYSIMRRVVFDVDEPISGPQDFTIPLLYSDDGGLWIEAIRVMWPFGYGANYIPGGVVDPNVDNQWFVDVVGSNFPGAAEIANILHLETFGAGDPGAGDNYPVGHGGPPFNGHYIPPGSFLGVRVQELNTGAGPGSDLAVQFHVRYRTKA